MSTELEVSIEKRRLSVFEKTEIIFLTLLQERKENYISIQMEHSKPFKQLLVKEILVNGLWRLYGSTALVVTKLAKYVTISVFFLIP